MTATKSMILMITSMTARNTEKFQEFRLVCRNVLYSSWVFPWRRKRSSRVLTKSASRINSTKVITGFTGSSGYIQTGITLVPRAAPIFRIRQKTSYPIGSRAKSRKK